MLFDKVLWQTFSTDIWREKTTTSADYSAEVIFIFLAFGIKPNNRLYTNTLHFMIKITSVEERGLEANELPLFVDVSGRVAAVAHINFIVKLSSSRIFFSFFSPAFSPVILNPKPLQRRVVFLNQPNSKSKSRRWCDRIMQKICCKSQT